MSNQRHTHVGDIAAEWEQQVADSLEVVSRSGSSVELVRAGESTSGVYQTVIGWYVPDDGIAYGRVPIHVAVDLDETAEVIDAAIDCLEYYEDELQEAGWRITDDGTLRRDDDAFVFDATIKRVVEDESEALEVLRALAADPFEYEVSQ